MRAPQKWKALSWRVVTPSGTVACPASSIGKATIKAPIALCTAALLKGCSRVSTRGSAWSEMMVRVEREEQPSKASVPIVVRREGTVRLVREEQPRKAR